MSEETEEIEELQADIAGLLLHLVYAPLVDDQHVRGVLPAPSAVAAVRVAVGDHGECTPDRLTAYEIPLRQGDELLTAHDVVGILRSAHTGTHIYPRSRVGSTMGITLLRVDPTTFEAAPFTPDDWSFTLMKCLAYPSTEERPAVRLRGFLFMEQGPLRLYLDSEDVSGVIAADVRPGGALTALLAALPSLLGEEWRTSDGVDDPHCRYLVDLTGW
ncbi:hypothetical protein [Streptomyces sp. NPDC014685]|uniref:hypothetical protein n=1 Tax=Streptomyces sp. NPDC014685 TaxID=3364881 RepID=UPI0036F7CCAC